jgi:hypothetical protein
MGSKNMARSKIFISACMVGAAVVAALVYARLVRPWHLRWGSTPEEAGRLFPGDDFIHDPMVTATHAIAIQAPVERVWQWVVQIGQGRGGFYSYDWLENLLGLNIHSTARILPEWQNPQVGDIIPFWPGGGVPIIQIEPPRLMVLGGSFAPDQPTGGSWAFVLDSPDPKTTRLIARTRVAGFSPRWLSIVLYRILLEPAHFIMERGMLLGIKRRAEEKE